MQIAAEAGRENTPVVRTDERAGKYLVFALGPAEFGIRVLNVREIRGIQDITPVPHTPAYLKGVINLRGKVVPVVDLRAKFGLPAESAARSCIVVIQPGQSAGREPHSLLMGIIVDSVAEVLNLVPGDIEDAPDFGHGAPMRCLLGMARVKGRMKILLDIGEALETRELPNLGDFIQSQP